MDTTTSVDAEVRERELLITRIFDAPRHLVFQAWTEPDRAARWWGPQGFVTTYCDMDVRPGGTFRVCMRSPEGAEHWKQGVYREVVEPELLVFTFAWEDADGKPANHVATNLECGDCHTTSTWLGADFDHSGITTNCYSCHNGTKAVGKQGNHMPTSNTCEACHTTGIGTKTPSWTPSKFDHTQMTVSTCAIVSDVEPRRSAISAVSPVK